MAVVTEEQMQAVVEILFEIGTDEVMEAAAGHKELAHDTKVRVRSRLFLDKRNPEKSVAAREAWAYTHPEYAEACEENAKAVGVYEGLKTKLKACEAVLSAWQTGSRKEHDIVRRFK
jgi:hypothetical protein